MKNRIVKYNEYQSVMKPVENSHNVPRYDYKNIADVLGDKYHIQTDSTKIKEFEEKVINKMAEQDKPKNDDFYIKMYKEYARQQRKDTPPYKDDTISQSDFAVRAYTDDVKMEMDNATQEAEETVNEEGGVATAVAGNGSGMGAVVTSTPSSIPGQTIGSNTVGGSFGEGGTVGSGDIGAGSINRNVIPRKSRRKERAKTKAKEWAKNMKNFFKQGTYKKGGDENAPSLMSFSEFSGKGKKKK
jgi:hypothetical protein